MSLMMHRTMQVLVALRRELDLSTLTLHNVTSKLNKVIPRTCAARLLIFLQYLCTNSELIGV